VIDDCINVFANIPDLFRLRTNFGGRCGSTVSLNEYASFMQHAVKQVETGKSVDVESWAEDGHLAAVALLYDIAIFVYSTQNKQWYVFNELARRGYVCFMSSPGHFNVLQGVDGPPVVPRAANTHAVGRHMFDASDVAWQHMQRGYSFTHVHRFPQHFSGVRIVSNPVVVFTQETTPVAVELAGTPQKETHYVCDFDQCRYVCDKLTSLAMHKMRCHGTRIPSTKTTAAVKAADNICNDAFPRSAAEVPHDAETRSVTSCDGDSMISRRSERIAKKREPEPPTVTPAEASLNVFGKDGINRPTVTGEIDIDCGVEVNTDIRTNIASTRTCYRPVYPQNDLETSSVTSCDSMCSRRSERIPVRNFLQEYQGVEIANILVEVMSENSTQENESITVETNENVYTCNVCLSTFTQPMSLKMHNLRVHKKKQTMSQKRQCE